MFYQIIKKMNCSRYLFFLMISFVLLVNCKKPEETFPDFTIDKPWENSQWAIYDTIPFQITLNTQQSLKQIKVQIVNLSQIPVTAFDIVEPSVSATQYQGIHIVNNPNIESGSYYFRVSVTNEDNTTVNRFVKIQIQEIPKRSEAIYVVAKQNNNTMSIFRLDTLPEFVKVLSLNTDYSGSDVSSVNGHFYICGRYFGPLACYDCRNGHDLLWKDDALLNPPVPWFEGMSFDGKNVLAGLTDHRIKGFHPGGNLAFVFQILELWPRIFLKHYDALQQKDFYIIGAPHFLGMSHVISVHYDVSYTNMQFLITNWELKKMFSKSNDEIYMFGNENGQGVMKIYSISQNNTYSLKPLDIGKLIDVVRVRPGIFIISHSQGLYIYNYSYNSLTPYGSFQGGGKLEYDMTTDKIYYAQQNSIQYFSFLSQNPEGMINFADSIVNVHILYNK
jgi:hypothetical protein